MNGHLKYLNYLIRHKWFVLVAGRKTKAPLRRLLIHDWSKLMPAEWFPYVEKFYGEWRTRAEKRPTDELIHIRFNHAWLHHLHFNPHHWQYWVLRNDDGTTNALRIPERFVREMVADWMGAGRAITGKWEAHLWYEQNKTKMNMHPDSRHLVEALLATTIIETFTLDGGSR